MGDGERSDATPEAARQAAHEAIVAVVQDHLAFNVAAYGKAWTGEDEDTEFIVADAAAKALAAAAPLLPGGEEADRQRELEFDARVALPEAQERFQSAERERDEVRAERLRDALREAISWSYGEDVTPERRDVLERLVTQSDAERVPQEDDPTPTVTPEQVKRANEMARGGGTMRTRPRRRGDEVETVQAAIRREFKPPWDTWGRRAALAALDARSGADTVKLAEVEVWLRRRLPNSGWSPVSVESLLAAMRAEFVSGADRPEGGQG